LLSLFAPESAKVQSAVPFEAWKLSPTENAFEAVGKRKVFAEKKRERNIPEKNPLLF